MHKDYCFLFYYLNTKAEEFSVVGNGATRCSRKGLHTSHRVTARLLQGIQHLLASHLRSLAFYLFLILSVHQNQKFDALLSTLKNVCYTYVGIFSTLWTSLARKHGTAGMKCKWQTPHELLLFVSFHQSFNSFSSWVQSRCFFSRHGTGGAEFEMVCTCTEKQWGICKRLLLLKPHSAEEIRLPVS